MIFVSTETGVERTYTYRELHREVVSMAAGLQALGVAQGDRVLLYMPMIPEAVFAMLACARLGAIHSVVFGGFASGSLASRIEDAQPKVIVSADAGMRGGKRIAYKPLLDEAPRLSSHQPAAVLLADRGLAPMERKPGRDVRMQDWLSQYANKDVPCAWLESNEPSYTLYTSGTTGRPKGVQRDVGGYAVALAASMDLIFGARAGETMFCTSDVGWVVGHSYIVYGPLLAGMTTILYEGLPTQGLNGQADGGIWWRLVEKYRANVMFSAPTAIRVLKRQDPSLLRQHDLSRLRALFLAGEPLDEPTSRWIGDGLGVPIVDNYWQTETGWPMIAMPQGLKSPSGNWAVPANRCMAGTSNWSMSKAERRFLSRIARASLSWRRQCHLASCRPSGKMRIAFAPLTGRGRLGSNATRRSTGRCATRMASSSFLVEPTTSSTLPDTASGLEKSKSASAVTPPSLKLLWLALLTP